MTFPLYDNGMIAGLLAGILIGLQDSSHFRSPSDVAAFHSLGQRVSQLTYNSRNMIGNGSTERVDGGISDFGVSIVEAMNDGDAGSDVKSAKLLDGSGAGAS